MKKDNRTPLASIHLSTKKKLDRENVYSHLYQVISQKSGVSLAQFHCLLWAACSPHTVELRISPIIPFELTTLLVPCRLPGHDHLWSYASCHQEKPWNLPIASIRLLYSPTPSSLTSPTAHLHIDD